MELINTDELNICMSCDYASYEYYTDDKNDCVCPNCKSEDYYIEIE